MSVRKNTKMLLNGRELAGTVRHKGERRTVRKDQNDPTWSMNQRGENT